jgi:L-iditol 2-dehydrogenase
LKAAVKTAQGDFEIKEVDNPKITRPDYALAKVKVAGICGTDLRHWKVPDTKSVGKIVGHELAGIVTEVGPKVTNVHVGDRVVIETVLGDDTCDWCRVQQYNLCPNLYQERAKTVAKAFAEYIVGPSKKFHILPDNISFEEAALLDSAAVSLHACHVSRLRVNDKIAIIGSGPIGLTLLGIANVFGAKAIVTDILDFQLAAAKKLGAALTVNTKGEDGYRKVMGFTGNKGVDIAYECVGGKHTPKTVPQAASYTRIGGKVCLVGGFDQNVPPIMLDWEHIQMGEINLVPSASYSYWGLTPEIEICINLLASGAFKVKDLITHRFPLKNINEAFNVTSNKEENNSIFTALLMDE